MKSLGKWMKLENNTLSEVTQSQKTTHGMLCWEVAIGPEAQNTPNTICRPQ